MTKKRQPTPQPTPAVVVQQPPEGGPGVLTVNLAQLQPPQVKYFGNTAVCVLREGVVALTFGQLEPPYHGRVQNYVSIEMSAEAAAAWRRSFSEAFRKHLSDASSKLGRMPAYPTPRADGPMLRDAGVYLAHVARALIGTDLAWVDFYVLDVPTQSGQFSISPVMRLEVHASVLSYVVDRLDELLAAVPGE